MYAGWRTEVIAIGRTVGRTQCRAVHGEQREPLELELRLILGDPVAGRLTEQPGQRGSAGTLARLGHRAFTDE